MPQVTWGTSPEDVVPITGAVPYPADESDEARRNKMERSLEYMGLEPGTAMRDVKIDRMFIGSCTNKPDRGSSSQLPRSPKKQ